MVQIVRMEHKVGIVHMGYVMTYDGVPNMNLNIYLQMWFKYINNSNTHPKYSIKSHVKQYIFLLHMMYL
jgi:hypothetical protein